MIDAGYTKKSIILKIMFVFFKTLQMNHKILIFLMLEILIAYILMVF